MKPHKDLPAGSQQWAGDVDTAMKRVAELEAIVRRLSENAGIDFANPKRGINTGDTPSVKSTVAQKLSSLADVQSYNVADRQVLSWSQMDQKWLPATLPTVGEAINWRPATENEHMEWYLSIDAQDWESNKVFGQTVPTADGSDTDSYGLVGTSDASAYLTAAQRWFGGPTKAHGYVAVHPYYVKIGTQWTPDDNAGAWDFGGEIEVGRGNIDLSTPQGLYGDTRVGAITLRTKWFYVPKFATADRPVPLPGQEAGHKGAMIYDTSLAKPLWWNSTAWVDALGNAV